MLNTQQLPFLLRNLRRGLVKRYHQVGVPTENHPDTSALFGARVTFRLMSSGSISDEDDEMYLAEHSFCMTSWSCPMCEFHGEFNNKVMLQYHMDWDHPEVNAEWSQLETVGFHSPSSPLPSLNCLSLGPHLESCDICPGLHRRYWVSREINIQSTVLLIRWCLVYPSTQMAILDLALHFHRKISPRRHYYVAKDCPPKCLFIWSIKTILPRLSPLRLRGVLP